MIKKLQKQMIMIVTLSLLVVMIFVIGAINIIYKIQLDKNTDEILQILAENNGQFPEQMLGGNEKQLPSDDETDPQEADSSSDDASTSGDESTTLSDDSMPDENPPDIPDIDSARKKGNNTLSLFSNTLSMETAFETRYFIVWFDKDGEVQETDTSNIAAVSPEEAQNYAEEVISKSKTTGYKGIYKYLINDTVSGQSVIFMDCQSELQNQLYLLLISIAIAFLSVLIVFILVTVLSGRAIHPVAESIEKQKQFITDAGHELKTPIAIISANNEVLELTQGENEWTESIHHQTERMTGLVQDLLTLSRMDEMEKLSLKVPFSISELVEKTTAAFTAPAATQNKQLITEITPDLTYEGEETRISQLITILCDNALKYSPEESTIYVILTAKGKNIRLSVKNECIDMPQGDLNRLFDRFYRGDSSRSRETGGYGIGLSIASSIVRAHKGKLIASREGNNTICFTVIF